VLLDCILIYVLQTCKFHLPTSRSSIESYHHLSQLDDMKLNIARVTSLLAPLASALPTVGPAVQADYDAIVVGGGPAGLAAASALGRVRRNVLLVDSGEYRNEVTRHVHDVLGFDGEYNCHLSETSAC
jgi:threonine dehydrogenase-like Zn-dependent dehydrogenase